MNKFICIGIVLPLLLVLGCSDDKVAQAELAAQDAAANWLKLVDNGQYAESWEQTAGFFKKAVPKEKWLQTMQALRKPLGGNLSRDVKATYYRKTLQGAPDGEYVVIKLESTFENKASAQEIITPMLDQDGQWRIAGYYLK